MVRALVAACLVMACTEAAAPGEATLESLSVSPTSAALQVGSTAQFSVSATWSDGGSTVPSVTWEATGGTITSGGLYTAGAVAGTFRVVARHDASGLADTAAVVLSTAPPAITVHVQEGFEDNNAGARGWYDNTAWTTTTAEAHTGSRSLAWSWAAGQILPSFGQASRHAIPNSSQVYVSYWVKYSSNWVGSGVDYHPHEFYLLTNTAGQFTGPSFTRLTTYIEQVYQAGGFPQVGTTDGQNIDQARVGQNLTAVTEDRATAGCNGNTDGIPTDCYSSGGTYNNGKFLRPAQPAFTATAGPGYKNEWHHVEVLMRMNTIVGGVGQTDGLLRYWFDGNLLIDRQNFLFRTGARATMEWNQFLMGPYIGVGSPVAQTAWIDDLVIASGRP